MHILGTKEVLYILELSVILFRSSTRTLTFDMLDLCLKYYFEPVGSLTPDAMAISYST